MKQIRNLQQGDSFTMNFTIKNYNGEPEDLNNGEDLAVGFYNEYGFKCVLKKSDDQIQHVAASGHPGEYTAFVSSDITKNFVGNVDVEIAVYNASGDTVSHADKVIKMYFEERKLNYDL